MRANFRKILCPVDFSSTSEYALTYAVALAEKFGAKITLLHVAEIPATAMADCYGISGAEYMGCYTRFEEAEDSSEPVGEDELEALATRMRSEVGCPVATRRRQGKAFVEIIRQAKEDESDLIVMGTHGRTGLPHVLIGSTAERVVRKAPCPVLTVKHPEHEFVMP